MNDKLAIVVDTTGSKREVVTVRTHVTYDLNTGEEINREFEVLFFETNPGDEIIFEDIDIATQMIKPQWDPQNKKWIETATPKEIDEWKKENYPQIDEDDISTAEFFKIAFGISGEKFSRSEAEKLCKKLQQVK